jgi:hypothetical protein
MNNTKPVWIFVIGFLVIMAGLAFSIVWVLRQAVVQTVAPVAAVNNDLATQVADFLHPTPTILPDMAAVVRDVRSLARLETIQFTIEKVITAESNQDLFGGLFGDKLIFIARGPVIAGIDMNKFSPKDMQVKDNVLYVHLPAPEVFLATLDNDKSRVYDRSTGLLTKGDVNLETTARQAAQDEIEKAALDDGILDLARQNAESYMYRLLRGMGYQEVIFVHDPETATPVPTETVAP